jgi:hypothetical protein
VKTTEMMLQSLLGARTTGEVRNPSTAAEIALSILLHNGIPTEEDLINTVVHVDSLRETVARLLLDRDPSQEVLLKIIEHVPSFRSEVWSRLTRDRAIILGAIEKYPELFELSWEELVKLCPTNEELLWVMKQNKTLNRRAWELLMQQSPSEEELREAFYRSRDDLWIKTGYRLLEIGHRPSDLLIMIGSSARKNDEAKALIVKATEVLMAGSPSKSEMSVALHFVDQPTREAICIKLMVEPDQGDLIHVVRFSESLREVAGQILLKAKDYEYETHIRVAMGAIVIHCPSLRNKAWKRYTATSPTCNDLSNFYGEVGRAGWDDETVDVPNVQHLVAKHILATYGSTQDRSDRGVVISMRCHHPDLVAQ